MFVEVEPPPPPELVSLPPVVFVVVVALELVALPMVALAVLVAEVAVVLVELACVALVLPIVAAVPVLLLVTLGQALVSQVDVWDLGSPLLQATTMPPKSNFSRMCRTPRLTRQWLLRSRGFHGVFALVERGKARKKLPTRCKLRARPNCSR